MRVSGEAETYGTIDSPHISGLVIVDEDFEVVYTLTKYSNNPVKIFFKSFQRSEVETRGDLEPTLFNLLGRTLSLSGIYLWLKTPPL